MGWEFRKTEIPQKDAAAQLPEHAVQRIRAHLEEVEQLGRERRPPPEPVAEDKTETEVGKSDPRIPQEAGQPHKELPGATVLRLSQRQDESVPEPKVATHRSQSADCGINQEDAVSIKRSSAVISTQVKSSPMADLKAVEVETRGRGRPSLFATEEEERETMDGIFSALGVRRNHDAKGRHWPVP